MDPRGGKIPWRRAWPPLRYSCLENPMDRGAWRATAHAVAELDMIESLNTNPRAHTRSMSLGDGWKSIIF